MALFKNVSNHSLNLSVNGVLKQVNIGGLVNLPDNMTKLHLRNSDLMMVSKLTAATATKKPVVPPPKKKKQPHLYDPLANKKVFMDSSVAGYDDKKRQIVYEPVVLKYTDMLEFMQHKFNGKVSICILTVNNYDVIKRCIDSIETHIKYENIEVLIGDTGSTDVAVLEYYKTLNKSRYKVFMGLEYNFSKNNNFLVSQSAGDFVLIMNNDVFVTHDDIGHMVKLLHFYPIGSVGSRLIFNDSRQIIQHDGQILQTDGKQWTALGHVNSNRFVREVPGINGYVCGNTAAYVMFRKSVFLEVGGFDDEYKDIFQDVALNLKIREKGFKHFCLREHGHIHVDHGTRDEGIRMGAERITDIQTDSAKILKDWVVDKSPPAFKRPVFSFIVSGTDEKMMNDMCRNIDSKISHEMFVANNRTNIFKSASEILNMGITLSCSKYNILCHQDVVFSKLGKLDKIIERIAEVESINNNWGVLGIAGAGWNGQERTFYHFMESYGKSSGAFKEIQTVDEFFFIIKNDKLLYLDEQALDHWHFYGADICLNALDKGFRNYVINIPMTHMSDGLSNLKNHYDEYKIQCKRLLSKWRNKFPNITTTTMHYKNNKITYYATLDGRPDTDTME